MNSDLRPRVRWLRALVLAFWLLAMCAVAVGALCVYQFRDRSPNYSVRVDIDGRVAAREAALFAGFARVKINPDLTDPKHPVWLAGFGQHRAATAIHDDLWAVACAIDDGHTRVGMVALDAIGFFHDDVVAVRQRLGAQLRLDYTVVCSTHNHSTPDLMGLWGPNFVQTGVNSDYRDQVIAAAARALSEAVAALEPARLTVHEIPVKPEGLLTDTRKPVVFDSDIRVMHFTQPLDGSTLGTVVGWADHPETPWSRNTEITADFPGYLREALAKGIVEKGKVLQPGLGGIHMYVNGAIGGLMTTSPSVLVEDPYTHEDFKLPCHDKAQALGRQLAARIFPVLAQRNSAPQEPTPITVHARSIDVPVSNKLFLLAPVLGVLDRGHPGLRRWNQLRSEVAVLTLGDVSIACVPGEIYPELVNGGIERAPGADFDVDPVEVPALRELMPGKTKFIFGLANDEIGYIIPKSEWDRKAPYLYGASKPPYGEVNSVGPDAAAAIHKALAELCGLSGTGTRTDVMAHAAGP